MELWSSILQWIEHLPEIEVAVAGFLRGCLGVGFEAELLHLLTNLRFHLLSIETVSDQDTSRWLDQLVELALGEMSPFSM